MSNDWDRLTIDWYADLENFLGRPPRYFKAVEPSGKGDDNVGTVAGMSLEIEGSVRLVSERFGGLSHKRIRRDCLAAGFDFDGFIENAVATGSTHRELKTKLMMSGASIKKVADRSGRPRRPRNSLKGITDQEVFEEFQVSGENISKTSRNLGICRKTVAAAIDRHIKPRR